MIGGYIGAGLGIQIIVPNGLARQVADLSGFIQIPGDEDMCLARNYDLDVDVVEGNDIRLRLFVYDRDGGEIFMDNFDAIVWNLRAGVGGTLVRQKTLDNGISFSDAINIDINAIDIDNMSGTYVHEVLIMKEGYLSTVVADGNLKYGNFRIRKKIATLI